MSRGRGAGGRFVSAAQVADERLQERAGLIMALLGPADESSLGFSICGCLEAERDLTTYIGGLYVDGKDSDANDARDRLYRVQTLREICQRLLEQVRT